MNDKKLKNIIEAVLSAADKPLPLDGIIAVFDKTDAPDRDAVVAMINALNKEYRGRGIEIVRVASGYRLQVKKEMSGWVSRLWEEKPARYTRAQLETLALIAYRQPITRGEIEAVRGVGLSSNIIRTLQEHEWIRVLGHRDVPGKPAMYGTTRAFLDHFNLKSLDELPVLPPLPDIDAIGDDAAAGLAARRGPADTSPERSANDRADNAPGAETTLGTRRRSPQDLH